MKKALVLLAALLTAACASNGGFVNDDVRLCAPGDPVTVEAGAELVREGSGPRGLNMGDEIMIRVRVTNLTDDEIEVVSVRTEQNSETTRYRMENAFREFKQTIAEGEDHIFELPTRGRASETASGYVTTRRVEVTVTVVLATGESYRCRFEL